MLCDITALAEFSDLSFDVGGVSSLSSYSILHLMKPIVSLRVALKITYVLLLQIFISNTFNLKLKEHQICFHKYFSIESTFHKFFLNYTYIKNYVLLRHTFFYSSVNILIINTILTLDTCIQLLLLLISKNNAVSNITKKVKLYCCSKNLSFTRTNHTIQNIHSRLIF